MKVFAVLMTVLGAFTVLGVFATPISGGAGAASVRQAYAASQNDVREIEVVVDGGYSPSTINIAEGERLRLKFIRREHTPCTREVVFASLNIRKQLPPNEPVFIDLPPLAVGEHEFKCGMNMIRGIVVVKPKA